jgi:tetratricopeptide (TPR) repeat protein
VVLLRAEVLEAHGDRDAALALLRREVAARPKETRLWAALVDVTRRAGKPAEAAEVVVRAHKQADDSIELRLARVRQAAAGGTEALEALARESRAGLGKAEQARLLRRLAEALQQAGASAAADAAWREVAALRPRDLRSRMMRFDLALRSGDDKGCRAILAAIRALEGKEGVVWRAGEAGLMVAKAKRGDRSGLSAARRRVAEVKERSPDWVRVPLLEAALAELEGQFDAAALQYQRAVDLGDRQPAVLARLARLHSQRGRHAEAGRALQLLEELGPLARDQARLAANIALAQRDFRRALALGGQAVANDSRDYRDHLWLARVQSAAGQERAAEQSLRRAVDVGATIPEPWVALVRHLARTGQGQQAEQALQEATRKLPASRAALALASCHAALGRLDRAEAFYRQALEARPRDCVALRSAADFYLRHERFRQAEPHLRQLLDPATRAPREYVAEVRRLLAVELAAHDPRAGSEALALLAENARAQSAGLADERARAFVMATQPAQRAKGLWLLRALADRQPLPPEGQLLLARGFEAAGDDLRARDLLLGLATRGDDPRALAPLVRVLTRQGDHDDAEASLRRLERLEPAGPRAGELRQALTRARQEKRQR